jgi:hypothetical protein
MLHTVAISCILKALRRQTYEAQLLLEVERHLKVLLRFGRLEVLDDWVVRPPGV